VACWSCGDALAAVGLAFLGGGWGVESELGTQQSELVTFEVADRDPGPAFGGADHGGELHGGFLVHQPRDDLRPAAFFFEAVFGQVRVRKRIKCRTGTRWIASSASRSSEKHATAAGYSRP
jgi:hypothetical protein